MAEFLTAKKRKKKSVTVAISVILGLLTVLALIFLFFNIWLYQRHFIVTVQGDSMNTTLSSGDILYATRSAKNVSRGDVVIIDATEHPVYRNPDGSEKLLIKRLIAIEGDCVKCEDGYLYLKKAGEAEYGKLDEVYLTQTTDDFEEVVVGEGEIFFLGDNRANSTDARRSGCMKQEDILGIVPKWAVKNKGAITRWEKFRKSVANFFTVDTVHRTGN
ncbi:MAG: signal peptidase I [Clostridia bacterium]|nr:signal peptidase I [Clostridia bacterium]